MGRRPGGHCATMAAMSGQRLVTAEELLLIHEPGVRCELVRGELRRMSPAGYRHGTIALRIGQLLANWNEQRQLGTVCAADTGFVIERDPDTVRAPDVAFVTAARHRDEPACFPGPPDLAVEVVSPGDTFTQVQSTALLWIECGVRQVWVCDPRTVTVTVYTREGCRVLGSADTLDGCDLLPGFARRVGELFGEERVAGT